MQDSGFAGAVRSDKAQRLPGAEAKVDAMQDLHGAIASDETVDGQHGRIGRQPCELLGSRRAVRELRRRALDGVDGEKAVDTAQAIAADRGTARRVGAHQRSPR